MTEKKRIIEPYEILIKAYTVDIHSDEAALTVQIKAEVALEAVILAGLIIKNLKAVPFELQIYIIP